MLQYARLTPGPGFRPGRAALYYSQRLITAPGIRRQVARCVATAVNMCHPPDRPGPEPAERRERDRAVSELRSRGIARLPDLLSPAAVRDIIEWLAPRPVFGAGQLSMSLSALPPGSDMAAYPLETVLACPHILGVANDASVLAIARGYLGCKPTLSSVGLRWSLPTPGRPADVQRFHRDTDDWRFLKLFVYLTDVDAGSGPHLYVAGSHATAGRLRARPYAREALERRYGPEAIMAITGPVGTSFVADTYGIHAGMVPENRPRLILQIEYSVLPVFAYLYNPVPLRPAGPFDRYVNRLLIADTTASEPSPQTMQGGQDADPVAGRMTP